MNGGFVGLVSLASSTLDSFESFASLVGNGLVGHIGVNGIP